MKNVHLPSVLATKVPNTTNRHRTTAAFIFRGSVFRIASETEVVSSTVKIPMLHRIFIVKISAYRTAGSHLSPPP